MKEYYFGKNTGWISESEAVLALKEWVVKNGHICNMIADPSTCCPVAHGDPENECDCIKVSRLKSREV